MKSWLLAICLFLSTACYADTTQYTLSWPAQDGNISFRWLKPPAGVPSSYGMPLSVGAVYVAVPQTGGYTLHVVMSPLGGTDTKANIRFSRGVATITYLTAQSSPLPAHALALSLSPSRTSVSPN